MSSNLCVCVCVFQAELLSPCRCNGSVRSTHQPCLIKWISERGSWTCELCYYKYQVIAISTKNPLQVQHLKTMSRCNITNLILLLLRKIPLMCATTIQKFLLFLKKVSYGHQAYIYLIKNTIKTVIMWNIITIWKRYFIFECILKTSFIPVMRSCIFSIITPVFSVTWSSEIIIICWFAAQETFLININVENSFCGNGNIFHFRILWCVEILKEQHLFEIEIFCYIINVFTVTFDQFNAS